MSDEKLFWEIAKLRLETDGLRHRYYQQPSFWISLVSLVVALGGTVGQSFLSSIRRERAELDVAKALRTKDSVDLEVRKLDLQHDSLLRVNAGLVRSNDSLRADNSAQQARNARVAEDLRSLQQATFSAALPPEARQTIDRAGRATYGLAVYCLSVTEARCKSLRDALTSQGYSILRGSLLPSRAPWLAARSTVLYYDDRAESDATQLAAFLSRTTGTQFVVSRGQGAGVSSSEARWHFRVHFIGS